MQNSRPHPHKDRSAGIWFHLGAVLTVVAWGVSFVSTKVLLDNGMHSADVYVYRFILAYILVLCACHKKIMANSWRDEMLFLTCGVCGGSIYFIAENTAIEYTLVTNVSLITSTSPLLTTMLVGLLYKSERPSRGFILGSFVAMFGVACVIFNSSFVVKMNPLGDLLSLLAAFSFAIYSIVIRKLNALYSVMFITRKTFFYGLITAVPFLLCQPEVASPAVLLNTEVWTNMLFLGMIASVLAFVVWAQAIKRLGAVKASNYLYFQPIVTLIASIIFLGEKLSIVGIAGCLLIIGGLWLGD
ncbi:MAG: DMT family transporter, partial [Muribaculaceae bacterium]|nr:DMT family transporter [Muribaculaceae bacterium]